MSPRGGVLPALGGPFSDRTAGEIRAPLAAAEHAQCEATRTVRHDVCIVRRQRPISPVSSNTDHHGTMTNQSAETRHIEARTRDEPQR